MSIIRLVCPEQDISTTAMFAVKSSADIHDHLSRIPNNQSYFPSATIRTKFPLNQPISTSTAARFPYCLQIYCLPSDLSGQTFTYTTSIWQITRDVSEHIHAFQRMNPFHFGLAFQNTILG